jgi:hypothetical protein
MFVKFGWTKWRGLKMNEKLKEKKSKNRNAFPDGM